ncbi:hypothetical protein [Micromonospora rosaria]|uniref:hypothetical protein n=1 Tax=Micromonospora rosaria TaxID=47874 RepID=UPI000A5AB57E|nr:hypothetical protein [Micromonospora rosaria]
MSDPRYVPVGLATAGRLTADMADPDLAAPPVDDDGTPVGSADAEADRARAAGAEPEETPRH